MKERPILFSGPMVRAILEGRKTQTRRVIKNRTVPPYQVGNLLWVREAWQDWCPLWRGQWCGHGTQEGMAQEHSVVYRADNFIRNGSVEMVKSMPPKKWRPSIFMPRWASRLTLEVVSIRSERLQDITEEDAEAEGADCLGLGGFASLWDSINGKKHPWASNCWVWVIGFKRVEVAR